MIEIKEETRILLMFYSIVFLFLFGIWYMFYGQDARFGRDVYNHFNTHVSDNEVKSMACFGYGFQGDYSKVNNIEYCGNVTVKVSCKFSNQGDACFVQELK